MNRCTVSQIIEQIAANADDSGVCATTPEGQQRIIADLNTAIQILLKRCDTDGALWWWAIPVCSGVFALPEDCLEARQIFINGFGTVQRDKYYQGQLCIGLNNQGTQCCMNEVVDMGDFAIPVPLPNYRPIYITLMADSNADAGVEVTVEIVNKYGARQRETLTMLSDMQYVRMEEGATDVTFVGKPQTTGNIRMYLTYDNGQRFHLCDYGPKVQSGAFRRKRLPQWCCRSTLIRVLGKVRDYKITSMDDILPICDVEALSWGLSAVTAMRRKDIEQYNLLVAQSANALYKGLEDKDSASNVHNITFNMGSCNNSFAGGRRGWF